jgi:hypothetical protein
MAHICIVTPDIIGPIRNGGIGTACFHLARYLAGSLGHRVSILFTGPFETGRANDWKAEYLHGRPTASLRSRRNGVGLLTLARY